MTTNLDRLIGNVCDWLARNTSPRGVLAYTAITSAGVPINVHLPVDRRDADRDAAFPERSEELLAGFTISMLTWSDITAAAEAARRALAAAAKKAAALVEQAEKTSAGGPKCSDPQYCNMHGHPCKCCGGSDTTCPTGTVRGHYWSYCCSNRTIWFLDCCGGSVTCPSSCVWCDNSSQPNWCLSYGGSRYVCTIAEDKGAC